MTSDDFLQAHSRFRVLRAFLGFSVGDVVAVDRVYDPHNAESIYTLTSDAHTAHLTALATEHLPILRDIDQYLVAV